MNSIKRKKIVAFFLIIVSVFFKLGIYDDRIVDYLNSLEKKNAALLVVSSQSDRTQTDVVKKNDFSLADYNQVRKICDELKIIIFQDYQGYQISYLHYWENTISVFRIQKIVKIIFPFHNYF